MSGPRRPFCAAEGGGAGHDNTRNWARPPVPRAGDDLAAPPRARARRRAGALNDHERVWHAVGARTYGSAAELSAAILAALPPEEASRRLADARVRADDGCLLLTTQLHWRRQRTAGLLHCTLCGRFAPASAGCATTSR